MTQSQIANVTPIQCERGDWEDAADGATADASDGDTAEAFSAVVAPPVMMRPSLPSDCFHAISIGRYKDDNH